MRALVGSLLVVMVIGSGFVACNSPAIGRECVNPTRTAVIATQISAPALECPARLCLLQPAPIVERPDLGGTDLGTEPPARRTCTAFCSSDDDCDPETKAQCPGGFVCAVATQSGSYCCRKMCICKADLVEGVNAADGGVATPWSCDKVNNPNVTCKNL